MILGIPESIVKEGKNMNQMWDQKNECYDKNTNRMSLLYEIMKYDFVLVDLQLYLDNHPDCTAALEDFNEFSQGSKELKKKYHELYGPLMNFGYMDSEIPWQWVDDLWPWEKNYMCGR